MSSMEVPLFLPHYFILFALCQLACFQHSQAAEAVASSALAFHILNDLTQHHLHVEGLATRLHQNMKPHNKSNNEKTLQAVAKPLSHL